MELKKQGDRFWKLTSFFVTEIQAYKAFTIYEIDLSKEDLATISNRKNFLHGRTLQIGEESSEFIEVYEASLRLETAYPQLSLYRAKTFY